MKASVIQNDKFAKVEEKPIPSYKANEILCVYCFLVSPSLLIILMIPQIQG